MRRLAEWLTNLILMMVVLIAIFALILPSVFASRLAVVYSGSMAPAMPVGAIAVMGSVDPAAIEVGDIIAFNPAHDPEATVSHRVIEVLEGETLSFRTKGDANEDPDTWEVAAANVIARVHFSIPRLGYALQTIGRYTGTRLGFGLLICLPTVLLITSAARDMNFTLSSGKRRARRKKKLTERRKKRSLRVLRGFA